MSSKRVDGWSHYYEYFHMLDVDMQQTNDRASQRRACPNAFLDDELPPLQAEGLAATKHVNISFSRIAERIRNGDKPLVQLEEDKNGIVKLRKEVPNLPSGRTLTNEDLRVVHAQLRAAAQQHNARIKAAAGGTGRGGASSAGGGNAASSGAAKAASKGDATAEPSTRGAAVAGGIATLGALGGPVKGSKVSARKATAATATGAGVAQKKHAPADAPTCAAAALETLLWFGMTKGEKGRKGGVGGAKGSLMRRKNESFVDLEQLSEAFDAHDAAAQNRHGSAASSSDQCDPLPDQTGGLDDVAPSNWDWVAAMSEAGLHDDGEEELVVTSVAAGVASADGVGTAAERAHPLSSLAEQPPQPSDLLKVGASASLAALGPAPPSDPSAFDSEDTSEAALSESGGGGRGGLASSGRASPLAIEVGPMSSSSVAGSDCHERLDDASCDGGSEGGDVLPPLSAQLSASGLARPSGGFASTPSPKRLPRERKAPVRSGEEPRDKAPPANAAPGTTAPTHASVTALAAAPGMHAATEAAAARAAADGATRRSRREHKPKVFLHEAVERPLLKWEKELEEQRTTGKRKGAPDAPPPAAAPAAGPPTSAQPKSAKRRVSERDAVYETDPEGSPTAPDRAARYARVGPTVALSEPPTFVGRFASFDSADFAGTTQFLGDDDFLGGAHALLLPDQLPAAMASRPPPL